MVQDAAEIETLVRERGITHLVHFTRVENLPSIFKHGLIPRFYEGVERKINNSVDGNRKDVCLSIMHVSKMFHMIRHKGKNERDVDWCVLVLRPDILWEKQCLFYQINAVSKMLRNKDTSLFEGVPAFEAMFHQEVREPNGTIASRGEHLLESMPTNEQAEIRVKGTIPISYLYQIHFHKESDYNDKQLIGRVLTHKGISFWRNREKWLLGNSREKYLKWLKDQFS